MPEFILDKSGAVAVPINSHNGNPKGLAWDDLDAFTQGYIEALFFTESSPAWTFADIEERPDEWAEAEREGTSDGTLPGDSGFGNLAPESLARIIRDCELFQRARPDSLALAYGHEFPARVIGDGTLPDSHRPAWDYDAAAAGWDFWYTRNGHGVGFWDRGLGEVGERLSEAARVFPEVYAYLGDDGKVYAQ